MDKTKKRTFLEFIEEKTKQSDGEALSSKLSLGDDNDFKPFVVSDDPNSQFYGKNSGLAPLIRAFKKGANWGWSKDDKSGEDKPVKTGGKRLFLTGGALRDHLAGKTPRNIELATNASPDEINKILKQAQLQYAGEGDKHMPNSFFILSKNKTGRPFRFGIRINNDMFELSTFSKNNNPDMHEPGSQSDDAKSRDFTINAMYLNLTNDDGPNKELSDFFGGAHHLKSGMVKPIGALDQRLEEDPMRALRYARMLSRYGSEGDPKDMETIKTMSDRVNQLSPETVSSEFFKGMNHDDCDARKYIKLFSDLGLLKHVFPNTQFDLQIPNEVAELGDKNAILAWLMRQQHPDMLAQNVGNRIEPEKLKKILFFIKSLAMPEMDETGMNGLKTQYLFSGIPERKLRVWLGKAGRVQPPMIDQFFGKGL